MRFESILSALMILSALDAGAVEARVSPYDTIAEHNVFRLRPREKVPVEVTPKPRQLRKTTLTGIATILGKPMAYITIDGIKPGEPAVSVMLAENWTINGIEVTSIDKMAGVVKIRNEGESQILNFELAKSSGAQPNQPTPILLASPPPVSVKAASPMSAEEQVTLIEIQRVKFKQEGNPIHSLLPATGVITE